MARRIDEDTILQLLLSDNSDEENSSESEKEDHIEVDPAYESVSEDEVSSLTQYPPPGLDVQRYRHGRLAVTCGHARAPPPARSIKSSP
ncbi:hypothetical protein EVAR_4654_1 [Eumeta japonica]|uniref:Uncharacterized protein n=1 Tax=Eumeta variegata TaxID=151549 RepID=A0A4C1YCL7_EUMVA|nr:hypothetical protein EVAR_4654_1 [Eumeta japonica]